MFESLLSPIDINGVTIPNRICFAVQTTHLAGDGCVGDRLIAYYEERAKGGCGLIVVGEISLHPSDRPRESMINVCDATVLPGLRKMTEAIQRHETRTFAHLSHSGFQCHGGISRVSVLGPSAIADIEHGETAKVMEPEEIEQIVGCFGRSAGQLREAGFDGIEISLGPRSLLRQFLSPLSNHRTDGYGGSLENRMRFPEDVVASVRAAVGRDYPVGIQLCADEMFYGAITLEDAKEVARRLEKEGQIDFVNVTCGTYYNLHMVHGAMHHPPGFLLPLAQGIKETVHLPVFANNRINTPELAEEILKTGKADVIALVRPLICDPLWVRKIRERRPEDVFLCVADNQGCVGRVNQHKAIGCIQNPAAGQERTLGEGSIRTAERAKRVIVIGGGPAGMEAARVAAMRGHQVTLYEKEKELGGQILIAKHQPGRKEIGRIVTNLISHLEKLKVIIELGVELDEALIKDKNPEALVVATGSAPREKPLPGDYSSSQVLNVWQVLRGEAAIGDRVLLIDDDGNHKSLGTAEFLADRGKSVDIVTDDLFVGVELGATGDLYASRQRLLQKGVKFITDMRAEEIHGTTVKAVNKFSNERYTYKGYDTVIVVTDNAPNDALYFNLKNKITQIYRAGDCVAPRKIDMAILEGNAVGRML